jgi:hypothetical protein
LQRTRFRIFSFFIPESESGVGATPKPDDPTDRFNMSKYDADVREKLHNLNLVILRTFVDHFHRLDGIGGVQAIPFMQVRISMRNQYFNMKTIVF